MRYLILFITIILSSFSFGGEINKRIHNSDKSQSITVNYTNSTSTQADTGATPLPGMRGTPSNLPDISIIGDFVGKISNIKDDNDKNKILVREIELAMQGYIYPEMRADVFLALHRHGDHFEPEICAAHVSFLRIVEGLSLNAGKIHVDFGKINKVHQHHRPYTDQPSALTNFLGPHGLVGEGASLGYLFPLPFFAQIDIGAWWLPSKHKHEECGAEIEEFSLADKVYSSRLWTSFLLSDLSELEIGASAAIGKGLHHSEHQDEVKIFGSDITLKLWPSAYERLIFQNELFHIIRKVPVGELKRYGLYNYIGYQPSRYWSLGFRHDWSENVFPDYQNSRRLSGIITNHLTETTKIRFQYSYNMALKRYEAYLQLVFGIGPHSHILE